MITNLNLYKIKAYFFIAMLTIPFALLYIFLFAVFLILIGLATGFLFGPRGIGFFLLALWGGYRTANSVLGNPLSKIRQEENFREHDRVKKEEKPLTKQSIQYENRLEDLKDKHLLSRKRDRK